MESAGYIGIFWYIDDRDVVEYARFSLGDELAKPTNASSPFISPAISHPMMWDESKVKFGPDKEYTYYPRGRVNYNVTKRIFEIDMDSCLHHNVKFLADLYGIFQLDSQQVLIVPPKETNRHSANYGKEGHYRCHMCEYSQLSAGIFWVITDSSDITDYKLLAFTIPCDADGNIIGDTEHPLKAKSGGTYNHKRLWEDDIKNNPTHKPYNKREFWHYPRGRVEIANNRATIYLNPNIMVDGIIDEIKRKFGLNLRTVSEVRVLADGSAHYKCFIDRDG